MLTYPDDHQPSMSYPDPWLTDIPADLSFTDHADTTKESPC